MADFTRPSKKPSPSAKAPLCVSLVLLSTAAVLWAGPWNFKSPAAPIQPTPAWAVDATPVRNPRLRPEIELAGYTYHCSDCHRHFPSPPETTRSLTQHRQIELQHGLNTRCFNCHNRTNRDAFVDDWGREIPYDQPQLLCSKCHGTVYRDWLAGSHGRTNGYWNTSKGPQERCRCIECHDPHHPPFAPMTPAAPPQTLRMGDQDMHHGEYGVHNPLSIYRSTEEKESLSPVSRPSHVSEKVLHEPG